MKHPSFVDGLPDEATAAKALSHPMRRQLLDELHARGPQSSKTLAEIVGANVQGVNHHVRTLERAGFVQLVEVVARRNVEEHFFRAVLQARVDVWNSDARTEPSRGSA